MKESKHDKEFWRRLGRANKNRGRSLERRVAGFLDFTRVPYSGGAGDWGLGDVVDGFYARRGYWFLECKSQPQGAAKNVSVRKKWIDKAVASSDRENRIPAIVTALHGLPETLVFLPEMTVKLWQVHGLKDWPDVEWETKKRGAGGFCVMRTWLREPWTIARLYVVGDRLGPWWVMRLETFKDLTRSTGYWVEDIKPDE